MEKREQSITGYEPYPQVLDSVQESSVNRNNFSLTGLERLEYRDKLPPTDPNLIQELEQSAKLTSVLKQKEQEWQRGALMVAIVAVSLVALTTITNVFDSPKVRSKPGTYQTTTYPTYIAREANLIVRPTPSIIPFYTPVRYPSSINNP